MPEKVWKSIDAWRGYYTYEPTDEEKKEGWRKITECHFIPHAQNDEFIDITRKSLRRYFDVKVQSGRTSNVFSGNIVVLVKPKDSWTKKLEDYVKQVDEAFVDYYTHGFSIFSGETYPIDLKGYDEAIRLKSKEKLREVV